MARDPDHHDRALAFGALEKRRRGERLTCREQRALRRVERYVKQQQREKLLQNCPRRLYCEMSGRQVNVLNDQAARYGIPVGQNTIDLGKVIRWIHDFLARNHRLLSGDATDELIFDGASQKLKREYLKYQIAEKTERVRLAQLDRLEQEGKLIDVTSIHKLHSRLASILRGRLEALQRLYGPEALKIMNEGLDESEVAIEQYFAESDTDHEHQEPPH